jgi:hypothetical protein
MKIPRRRFLHLAAGAVALPATSRFATAQTYPTRPITLIVPFAPGGVNDVIARVMADRMRRSLGQPIIIENVTGADGGIATTRAARARSDGYTIDLGNNGTHGLNGALYPLQYDVLNDFAPISPLVTAPEVLFARKSMAAKDLNELIAWLKANPNKVSAGITALGRLISERNRDAICSGALSWQRSRDARLGGWSDRSAIQPTGSPTIDAGREHKGLCSYKQHAHGASARHPDLCQDGTAEAPLVRLDRPFRTQRHAKRYHRQAQCGDGGSTRRADGAISARRSRA